MRNSEKEKEQHTKADIVDMELYEFFDLIARSNNSDVMTIRAVLQEAKGLMLECAEEHKKKMFAFDDKSFDGTQFDNELTYMVHCFALAMYIDKKITLCDRRIEDLVPEVFKKYQEKDKVFS